MPEKEQKNKSGIGKFFLGAAIGAAVGAIASKFIKLEASVEEEEEDLCEAAPKSKAKTEKPKTEQAEKTKKSEAKQPAKKESTK